MGIYNSDCPRDPEFMARMRRLCEKLREQKPVPKVSDGFSPLMKQVDELELKANQLGELVATLQVNFGSEIGRLAKIAKKDDPPLKQLMTVLEYFVTLAPELAELSSSNPEAALGRVRDDE